MFASNPIHECMTGFIVFCANILMHGWILSILCQKMNTLTRWKHILLINTTWFTLQYFDQIASKQIVTCLLPSRQWWWPWWWWLLLLFYYNSCLDEALKRRNLLVHFTPLVFFYNSWKQKTRGCLCFQGV